METHCRSCKTELMTSSMGLFCRTCYVLVETPSQPSAPPARREKPLQPAQWKNEAELVQAIREAVQARGWRVYRIGQHIVKGSGSDAGVPDLLCIYPAAPPHTAIIRLLEAKVHPNTPTTEQQEIIDIGASVAVYSVEEALEALER